MKRQIESSLRKSFYTLSIVFLIFFAMAFSCRNDTNSNTTPSGNNPDISSTGGRCSTKEEFKAIITHDLTYLARDYEKKEVIFHSFEVGAPTHYENYQERYFTNTDNAYPVTTDFDVITHGDSMKSGRVYRDRYKNTLFMCYTITSKNTCICFGERNSIPVERRQDITDQN